jgi:twitching motility two-component system response regulator PilH
MTVDRAPEVLELYEAILDTEGFKVSSHQTVSINVPKVKDIKPDLVITDYLFENEEEGRKFIQELRQEGATRHVPVIICTTATRQIQNLKDLLQVERISIISKPFDLNEFVGAVYAALNDN